MKIRNGSHPKLNRLPASLACGRASRLGTPTNPALYVYLWLNFVVISDNWWKVWIRSMLKIRDGSPLGSFPIRSVGGAGLTLTGCNNLCSKMSTQYSREHPAHKSHLAHSTAAVIIYAARPSDEHTSLLNMGGRGSGKLSMSNFWFPVFTQRYLITDPCLIAPLLPDHPLSPTSPNPFQTSAERGKSRARTSKSS